MKKLLTKVTVYLCVSVMTGSAAAQLMDMAPAWRGHAGTTLQGWDFVQPIAPQQAVGSELGDNPNGPALLTYYPGMTNGWVQDLQGHTGVLPLSGSIQIDIPNFPADNPYKDIMVQLIWAKETPRGVPFVDEFVSGEVAALVETVSLDGFWNYSRYAIHLEPNPPFEQVWISGSILVDSIIIDTICAPEPVTLALLGLGGLLLRRRK